MNVEDFIRMIEKLVSKEIFLNEFKDYVANLENIFRENEIDIQIDYLDLLLTSNVKCTNESETLELRKLKKRLQQLKFEFYKKYFEKIDLNNYYEKIRIILSSQFISFDEFLNYFRLFSLIIDSNVTSVDLNEFGTLLLNAKVTINDSNENSKLLFTKTNIKLMLEFCIGTTKKICPKIK